MNKLRYINPINFWNDFRISCGSRIRKKRLKRQCKDLKNTDFTIFTENCLAGALYHDFGMQFRTPLINGGFSTQDYIKFLTKPQFYMQQKLVFVSNKDESLPLFYRELDCPVARIEDLHFRFTHYQMKEDEICELWNRRIARINWENLFVVLCEKKGCTYEQMKEFESLPYKNKLILTSKYYPKLKSAFQIKGFENIGYIDNLLKEMPSFPFNTKRYYEQFNFINWLNTGKIEKQ